VTEIKLSNDMRPNTINIVLHHPSLSAQNLTLEIGLVKALYGLPILKLSKPNKSQDGVWIMAQVTLFNYL